MFGGSNGSTPYGSDTWEYDGTDWTDVTPSTGSPRGRHSSVMAWDAARGSLLMFGGSNGSTPYGSDTWEL